MKIKEIRWKSEQHSTDGYVGNIRLFSIHYDSMRSRGEPEDPKGNFILATTLPQIKKQKCKGIEEGKEIAIKILEYFVKKMLD